MQASFPAKRPRSSSYGTHRGTEAQLAPRPRTDRSRRQAREFDAVFVRPASRRKRSVRNPAKAQQLLAAPPAATWFVVDQNGEVFRANDWGCSLVRMQGTNGIDSAPTDVWYPAASFGDVGAASGAVATCMAMSAFERGYSPSPHAVVMTNSDGADANWLCRFSVGGLDMAKCGVGDQPTQSVGRRD